MKNWKDTIVHPDDSMKSTMEILDKGALQIALVMDDDCHLLGTVTDGDVRRAILNDLKLNTPTSNFMNSNPITGLIDEGRQTWQRIMQRHNLKHLPLLDSKGCLMDLVRYELPIEPDRENPIVLMAGGLGTRLRPLTNEIPKPLIQVGSKPVLETIIENFAQQGFNNIFLCINYKGDMIQEYFGDGSNWDVNIKYLTEPKRLGTAGALRLLPTKPNSPVIVMNGDLLTKVDFVRLLDFHQQQNFSATVAVREHHYKVPYGVLKIKDGYNVEEIVEKPTERYQISAGIYVLSPETLDLIPVNEFYDMPALFQNMIQQHHKVGSFPLREYWIDIGRLEDLEQAHTDFFDFFS